MSKMTINRRGFIALSAAGAAAGLFGIAAPEAWTHHGVLVRVDREPGKVTMSWRADGKTYGLGFVHDGDRPRFRRMDAALRRSVRHTIDQKSGFTEHWLAEQKAQFARMAA